LRKAPVAAAAGGVTGYVQTARGWLT